MERHVYRGIVYAVQPVNSLGWDWEILPPQGIKGLRREGGRVEGAAMEAYRTARRAIDDQIAKSGDLRLW